MSRSYWLALVAVVGFALTVHAKPESGADSRQPNTSQSQRLPAEKTEPVVPALTDSEIERIARALKAIDTRESPSDKPEYASQYLQSQKDMATNSGLMFRVGLADTIITFFGVLLVAGTLVAAWISAREAKRAANAAEKTVGAGQAQVRAYLTCIDSKFQIVEDAGVWCWPAFKNTGKSPAKDIWVEGYIGILGEKNLYRSEIQHSIVSNIAAESSENGMFAFPNIGAEYIQRIKDGQTFEIGGTVQWTDVFGNVEIWPFRLTALAGCISVRVEGIAHKWEGTMKAINRDPLPPELFDGDDDQNSDSGEPQESQTH